MSDVTVNSRDLDDALMAVRKLRSESPERHSELVTISSDTEDFVTGTKRKMTVVHDAVNRTYNIDVSTYKWAMS